MKKSGLGELYNQLRKDLDIRLQPVIEQLKEIKVEGQKGAICRNCGYKMPHD